MAASVKRKAAKKPSTVINMRLPHVALELIDQAARSMGKNRSEFMQEASLKAAHEALLDMRVFYLNDEQWNEFQGALDAPVKVNPALRRALQHRVNKAAKL